MDWTDTILMESASLDDVDVSVATKMQVLPVQGVSLLHGNAATQQEVLAALKLLRGFRAAGRRIVLCDTAGLAESSNCVDRQLGHRLVDQGTANLVVSCGQLGREVAIGSRDAGLDLASVVVCADVQSACEVLTHQLIPGDTVLLLGVGAEARARLVLSLEKRLSYSAKAA